jgi:hypothetical protein
MYYSVKIALFFREFIRLGRKKLKKEIDVLEWEEISGFG